MLFLLLFALEVALPLYLILMMARRSGWTRRDLGLQGLFGAVYHGWAFLLLPWGFFWYPLRYLEPLAFVAVAASAVLRLRREEQTRSEVPKHRASPLWNVLLAALLGFQAVTALRGVFVPRGPVEVAFPLRDGVALVGHGGAHVALNYHNAYKTQRYALDIVGLNSLGAKAVGLSPSRLDQYAVYGRTVSSPCDGTVLSVENHLAEQAPPQADSEHPAGNHVEIEAKGIRIFLAHMQRGSVRVKPGDRVRTGDPIGLVGNSGNTSEPHLHIHAVRGGKGLWEGEGIPLTFGGRFLVRNDLVFGR